MLHIDKYGGFGCQSSSFPSGRRRKGQEVERTLQKEVAMEVLTAEVLTALIQALKPYPAFLARFRKMMTDEERQVVETPLARLAAAHYYVEPGPGGVGI